MSNKVQQILFFLCFALFLSQAEDAVGKDATLKDQHLSILEKIDNANIDGINEDSTALVNEVKDHLRHAVSLAQRSPDYKPLARLIVQHVYSSIYESHLRFDYSDQSKEFRLLLSSWTPGNEDDVVAISEQISLILNIYAAGDDTGPLTVSEVTEGVREKIKKCGQHKACATGDFLFHAWLSNLARHEGRWSDSTSHTKKAGQAFLKSGVLPSVVEPREFLELWNLTGEFYILKDQSKVAEVIKTTKLLYRKINTCFYERALSTKEPSHSLALVRVGWGTETKLMNALIAFGQNDLVTERASEVLTEFVLPLIRRHSGNNEDLILIREKLKRLIVR